MDRVGKRRVVTAACILVMGLCAVGQGAIIYVDDGAAGAHNGSSWADAFTHLQDALATAQAGDEIRVAQGVYKPDQGIGVVPGDRNAAFRLIGGVTLRGGFAGLKAKKRDAQKAELHQTVLSGDLKGDDTEVRDVYELGRAPARGDNSECIIKIVAGGAAVLLEGCTITGAAEGAIESEGAGVTITDCVFTDNATSQSGGAIYSRGGDLTLTRCTFAANWASGLGGAIYANAGCFVTATECSFAANQAGSGGAAAYSYAEATMTGCTFDRNAALGAGAVGCVAGTLALNDCEFRGNCTTLPKSAPVAVSFASDAGGALGTSNTRSARCYASVIGCCFEENAAEVGGAISSSGQTALRECIFAGNRAGVGGAAQGSFGPTIENCVFAGNRAQIGGAVELTCSSSSGREFVNCTFMGNRAERGTAVGRGACAGYVSLPPLVLTNCILWDGEQESEAVTDDQSKPAEITFSDILGGWSGEGNIDADPCFADPGYWDPNGTPDESDDDFWVGGDYHLKSQAGRWDASAQAWVRDDVTSPCLDAGDPNTPLGTEPFPNGGFINLGAYGGTPEASRSYFGGPVCETQIAGDINGDCKVDQTDMDILLRHWLAQVGFPPAVAVTAPPDRAEITYPTPIVFEVDAFDSDGAIDWLEFVVENYHGGGHGRTWARVAGGTNHWEFPWDWARVRDEGVYLVWAAAKDNDGNQTVSEKIRVTLHPAK